MIKQSRFSEALNALNAVFTAAINVYAIAMTVIFAVLLPDMLTDDRWRQAAAEALTKDVPMGRVTFAGGFVLAMFLISLAVSVGVDVVAFIASLIITLLKKGGSHGEEEKQGQEKQAG